MSCKTIRENIDSSKNFFSAINNGELIRNNNKNVPVPNEPTTLDAKLLSNNNSEMQKLSLKHGIYKLVFHVPYDGKDMTLESIQKQFKWDSEFKRIHFYKIDVVSTNKKDENGNKLAKVSSKFAVIDNQISLLAISWGISITAGLTAGYFFFDKVEQFSKSPTVTLWTILAGIGLIYTMYSD